MSETDQQAYGFLRFFPKCCLNAWVWENELLKHESKSVLKFLDGFFFENAQKLFVLLKMSSMLLDKWRKEGSSPALHTSDGR